MMRHFLRIFLAIVVISLAVLTTGFSCSKVSKGNNNNDNNNTGGGDTGSGGNTGGGGDTGGGGNTGGGGDTDGGGNAGGGGTPNLPAIVIDIPNNSSVAKLDGTTIKIKGSEFPTTSAASTYTARIGDLSSSPTDSLKKVFEITITSGDTVASGGLIMVGTGDITHITNFSDQTSGTGSAGAGTVGSEGFMSYFANGSETYNQSSIPKGWNHYGVFMNGDYPTADDANASPFAFTRINNSGHTFQPFLFCRSTLSHITSSDPADDTALLKGIKETTTFAGGQRAYCYIGSKGNLVFTGANVTTWLNTAVSATFKKTFNIAIGGFRTDAKTVNEVMPGANASERVTALNDGLGGTDIAAIIANNPYAFKKFSVTIVADDSFSL